jgi:hypothetical protein
MWRPIRNHMAKLIFSKFDAMLKPQRGTFTETANDDYRLSLADKGKQTSVFRLQKTNGSCRFLLIYIYRNVRIQYICVYIYIYIYICCRFKQKTEDHAIFLNPFTVLSMRKQKFAVCLFVYEGTNASYPFANRLNGPNDLAPLC